MAQKSKSKPKQKTYAATLYVPKKSSPVKKKAAKKKTAKPKTKTVVIDEREQARSIEVYSTEDQIISDLTLPTPCEISLKLLRDSVILQIGPRDFQWSRTTGELTAAGTDMTHDNPPAVEPDPNAEPVEGLVESDIEVFDETDKALFPEDVQSDEEHLTDPNSVDEEKAG